MMEKRMIKKVLLLGSGALKIGQAGEFDRLIEEQAFDYIVTRDGTFEWEGYEIVCNEQIVYTNISGAKIYGDYFLYKKIS